MFRRCSGARGAVLAARFGWIVGSTPRMLPSMGVRTRGLDIAVNAKRQVADAAARAEAKAVIERWNEQPAARRDMLWSPTIRAALIAGTPWLEVFCPGSGTSRVIDLRKVDRHPLASVATLVLGLRCSWCPETAPMPRILTNNAAERALRGFALGRKSWLFAGSERGADRAAVMATLIMTSKLNDVDPQA
jgi:Transposase IS66 family